MTADAPDKPWYITDEAGNLRFTPEGIAELRPYLARAGIDIRTIRTKRDYLEARRRARPYFLEHLYSIARGDPNKPPSLEQQMLMAIVAGDRETLARIERQLETRQSLRVIR